MYLSNEGGKDWQYEFNHEGVKDGDVITVGNLTLKVMHTPGHTPESISFLLTDHPAAPVRLSVRLVWAGSPQIGFGGAAAGELDPELAGRLRRLLRYDSFVLLSETRLEAREGDEVAYEFRSGYQVRFRLGTLLAGQRLRLRDFRVSRTQPPADLIHTTVNLPLAQPLILGLTRDEGSASALLVVLAYEPLPGV